MAKRKVQPPTPGTKLATLLRALKHGVTLEKLASDLNWQHHSVRAAMTRLRQRGYTISCKQDKAAKTSIYRLGRARGRAL